MNSGIDADTVLCVSEQREPPAARDDRREQCTRLLKSIRSQYSGLLELLQRDVGARALDKLCAHANAFNLISFDLREHFDYGASALNRSLERTSRRASPGELILRHKEEQLAVMEYELWERHRCHACGRLHAPEIF